jgi:hypothetical protein
MWADVLWLRAAEGVANTIEVVIATPVTRKRPAVLGHRALTGTRSGGIPPGPLLSAPAKWPIVPCGRIYATGATATSSTGEALMAKKSVGKKKMTKVRDLTAGKGSDAKGGFLNATSQVLKSIGDGISQVARKG